MNNKTPMPVSFWVLIGSVGGLVALLGICFLVSRISFLGNAKKVDGRVTSIESYVSTPKPVRDASGSSKHRYTTPKRQYKLVVEYEVEGRTYSVMSEQSFQTPPRKNGSVTIAYNPHAPGEALIEEASELWFLPWFFVGIGLFFVGVAKFGYNHERSRRHLYPSK